jgi:hypothetical protein
MLLTGARSLRRHARFAIICTASAGRIGPELTGGYEDVDYLLNNILDPNAIIGKDYQQTFVKTKDGADCGGHRGGGHGAVRLA